MAEIKDLNVVDNSNTARFPEGQAPSTVNDGARAGEGLYARGFKDTIDTTLTSTGTASNYAVTTNRGVPDSETGLYDGFTVTFKANHTNSTGGTTLTVTMLTTAQPSKAIVDQGGNALPSGVIIQDGYATVVYQAANDRFVLISNTASPLEADQDPKLSADLSMNGFGLVSDNGQDIPITPGGTNRTLVTRATISGYEMPDSAGSDGQALVFSGGNVVAGAASPFTEYGESSPQNWTTGSMGTVSLASLNLSGAPKLAWALLECVGADNGYSVGDKISYSDAAVGVGSVNLAVSFDSTNVYFSVGSSGLMVPFKNGGGSGITTDDTNWRIVVAATR